MEMVAFDSREEIVSLPPPPRRTRLSGMARLVRIGRWSLALGAVLLIVAVFVPGWMHCGAVRVTLNARQFDDSYFGEAVTTRVNSYSLAVLAFLRMGFAQPMLITAMVTVTLALLVAGARSRLLAIVVALGALTSLVWLVLDLRALPRTITAIATAIPSGAFPSSIRPLGVGPGPMMLLALAGLLLILDGSLLVGVGLPRALRATTEHQPEREQYAVDEFEAGRATEHGIQGAAPLPQHPTHQWNGEWQTQPRQ